MPRKNKIAPQAHGRNNGNTLADSGIYQYALLLQRTGGCVKKNKKSFKVVRMKYYS